MGNSVAYNSKPRRLLRTGGVVETIFCTDQLSTRACLDEDLDTAIFTETHHQYMAIMQSISSQLRLRFLVQLPVIIAFGGQKQKARVEVYDGVIVDEFRIWPKP